jgi:hypothetical protein
MTKKIGDEKEWKAILLKCLSDLATQGIIQYDLSALTGKLVLEMNLNQGGITDLDVSIKRKYK